MPKVALDSNIVIYFLGSVGSLQEQAALVIALGNKGVGLTVSALVFLELLSKSSFNDTEAQELYEHAQQLPFRIEPIQLDILLYAAELRRNHPTLKTPDAIHLATAIVRKCDFFVTNDVRLFKLKLAGIKIVSPRNINRLAP